MALSLFDTLTCPNIAWRPATFDLQPYSLALAFAFGRSIKASAASGDLLGMEIGG